MLNEKILNTPVILFLGAGASIPLGKPGMDTFVDNLKPSIVNQEESQLLTALIQFRGKDLELILGELDTLIGLSYADISAMVRQGNNTSHRVNLEPSVTEPLRDHIKHKIIQEYRNIPDESVQTLYEPLFDRIFEQYGERIHCLPVFTTNYDRAIERFCSKNYETYELTDGFNYNVILREDTWNQEIFHSFHPVAGKRNIVLFKLHGSVDWVRDKTTDRIRRAPPMFDKLEEDAFQNVLIYPATAKIATAEPYFTAYTYYARCCDRATLCLTIGYSFRDYDALSRLRSSMLLNEKLKLALLSPSSNKILEKLPLPQNRVKALPFRFGDPTGSNDYLTAIQLAAITT